MKSSTRSLVVAVLAGTSSFALSQTGPATQPGTKTVEVDVQGVIYQAGNTQPTPELINQLKVPAGFKVSVFAEKLINPRMLAVADDGTVYVTRRDIGDCVMLKDTDGDGKADVMKVVAERPDLHGIAIRGSRIYFATIHDVYLATRKPDGTVGELQRIIQDLPDAGQHPNRTLAFGPDGMLYISSGSTTNAANEPNPENGAMLKATPDGKSRAIFARGLRNTIGFAWHPVTGELWGMDHGMDWLGNDEVPEELNKIEEGKFYGWPTVYGKGKINAHPEPPAGLTADQIKAGATSPVLEYRSHSAPMQFAFYTGSQFPSEFKNDAFVAMRGSWNRKPPSGYEVVRIHFDDKGQAQTIEPFLTGFLVNNGDDYTQFARPVGCAVAKDGSLLVTDDRNGVIYRVSYDGSKSANAQ